MYPTSLTHRQASYGESEGGAGGGGLFGRGASAGATAAISSSASVYGGTNGDYYQQLQAHAANTRQLLAADGPFNSAYSSHGSGGGKSRIGGRTIFDNTVGRRHRNRPKVKINSSDQYFGISQPE